MDCYQICPVPGYEVASVRGIVNPVLEQGFELHLQRLNRRFGKAGFEPKWQQESSEEEAAFRALVEQQLTSQIHPYLSLKLLPVWHGTRSDLVSSICEIGYVNLATTDSGFFGKGLYSTVEAEYAHRVYSRGGLLLNWMAFYSAYPVIDGDMQKLIGKGNYQNYDAHYVPVYPISASPHEKCYMPIKRHQTPKYTEVVVFDSAACLPRYIVELEATLLYMPSIRRQSSMPSLQANALTLPEIMQVNEAVQKPSPLTEEGLSYRKLLEQYQRALENTLYNMSSDEAGKIIVELRTEAKSSLKKLTLLDALEGLVEKVDIRASALRMCRSQLLRSQSLSTLGKYVDEESWVTQANHWLRQDKEAIQQGLENETDANRRQGLQQAYDRNGILSMAFQQQSNWKKEDKSGKQFLKNLTAAQVRETTQNRLFDEQMSVLRTTFKSMSVEKLWQRHAMQTLEKFPKDTLTSQKQALEEERKTCHRQYHALKQAFRGDKLPHSKQRFLYGETGGISVSRGGGRTGATVYGFFHLSRPWTKERWSLDVHPETLPAHSVTLGSSYFSTDKSSEREAALCLDANYQQELTGATASGYGRSDLTRENQAVYQAAYQTAKLAVRYARLYETPQALYDDLPLLWKQVGQAVSYRHRQPTSVPGAGCVLTRTFMPSDDPDRCTVVASGVGNLMVCLWDPTNQQCHTLIRPRHYEKGQQYIPISVKDKLTGGKLQSILIDLPRGSLLFRLSDGAWKALAHHQSSLLIDPETHHHYLESNLDEKALGDYLTEFALQHPKATADQYRQLLQDLIESTIEMQKTQLWAQRQAVATVYHGIPDKETKQVRYFLEVARRDTMLYQQTIGLLRSLNVALEGIEELPLLALGQQLKQVYVGDDIALHVEVVGDKEVLAPAVSKDYVSSPTIKSR